MVFSFLFNIWAVVSLLLLASIFYTLRGSHLSEHIGTRGVQICIEISITKDKRGGMFMYFCVFACATVGFQVFG